MELTKPLLMSTLLLCFKRKKFNDEFCAINMIN